MEKEEIKKRIQAFLDANPDIDEFTWFTTLTCENCEILAKTELEINGKKGMFFRCPKCDYVWGIQTKALGFLR